jgi:8-oxo-dGTP pyrophosphatase MutT (NUDIX family)
MEENLRELLSVRKRDVITDDQLKPAAVLIPLFNNGKEYYLVFIKRSQQVEEHKGEVSFPGGLCEKCDEGVERTALRETFEEIGVCPQDVVIAGVLDDMRTASTLYRVTPVIGIIPASYPYSVNPVEVDEVINIPLSHLLNEENGGEESIVRRGLTYTGPVYRYKDYLIWGATARIIKNFLEVWRMLKRSKD